MTSGIVEARMGLRARIAKEVSQERREYEEYQAG
jgi:hypothetical protein